jgi:ectoine hydroxylase-related dioxygenase (phytanoyl-CoA dioxygenase family)
MIEDLATISEPLTEIFEQPKSAEQWQDYMLSDQQISHFEEYGFVQGIRVLNEDQVESLCSDLQDIVKPDNPGRELFYEYKSNEGNSPESVLFHALGAWRVSRGFHDVLWAPGFRMAAYQLLGKKYRLFHDQLFCKPAGHGGTVAWHQDYSYWTWTKPMAHLTCWIALDDVTTENGCLYYIPKSQTWGLLPITGLASDMESVKELLSDDQIELFKRRIPIELKKGEACFHHPLMMHGSYANKSQESRRATVINVFADGVVSNRSEVNYGNFTELDNYPRVPKGQKMEGVYYPLLFDPKKELSPSFRIPTISNLVKK